MFKVHGLLCHSTLGSRNEEEEEDLRGRRGGGGAEPSPRKALRQSKVKYLKICQLLAINTNKITQMAPRPHMG